MWSFFSGLSCTQYCAIHGVILNQINRDYFVHVSLSFRGLYPTNLKGSLGIVFTHGVGIGGGRQAGSGKKFAWAVFQKQ